MDRRAFVLPAFAALAAVAVWWSHRPHADDSPTPAASWCIGPGPSYELAQPYDELAPDTPFRLRVQCGEPRHVYVFSHSDTDGTLLLHPAPELKGGVAQPLPAGASWLPGRAADKDLLWTTRQQVLPLTTFVVVAASAPVAELEALLPKLRRWSNTARTDGSMQVVMPKEGEKSLVGGPRTPLPDPLLQRAANLSATATLVNGPLTPDSLLPGVWLGSWRTKEKAAAPGGR